MTWPRALARAAARGGAAPCARPPSPTPAGAAPWAPTATTGTPGGGTTSAAPTRIPPADDTVIAARVAGPRGQTVATLVNYACHPTTLAWENTLLSPDYPGAMRETVERATGAPCVFVLGACGDIGPRYGFTGDPLAADQNGQELGYAALAALAGAAPARHRPALRRPGALRGHPRSLAGRPLLRLAPGPGRTLRGGPLHGRSAPQAPPRPRRPAGGAHGVGAPAGRSGRPGRFRRRPRPRGQGGAGPALDRPPGGPAARPHLRHALLRAPPRGRRLGGLRGRALQRPAGGATAPLPHHGDRRLHPRRGPPGGLPARRRALRAGALPGGALDPRARLPGGPDGGHRRAHRRPQPPGPAPTLPECRPVPALSRPRPSR